LKRRWSIKVANAVKKSTQSYVLLLKLRLLFLNSCIEIWTNIHGGMAANPPPDRFRSVLFTDYVLEVRRLANGALANYHRKAFDKRKAQQLYCYALPR